MKLARRNVPRLALAKDGPRGNRLPGLNTAISIHYVKSLIFLVMVMQGAFFAGLDVQELGAIERRIDHHLLETPLLINADYGFLQQTM